MLIAEAAKDKEDFDGRRGRRAERPIVPQELLLLLLRLLLMKPPRRRASSNARAVKFHETIKTKQNTGCNAKHEHSN